MLKTYEICDTNALKSNTVSQIAKTIFSCSNVNSLVDEDTIEKDTLVYFTRTSLNLQVSWKGQ